MENAKRPLPRELLFLRDFARAKELPVDELLAWLPKQLEQIRLHAGQLRQHGFDPDYMVGLLQPVLARAQAAQAELERAEEERLHAVADQAEAARKVVDAFEQVVAELKAAKPFHPDLPELEDQLEQLRQQYPKLGDD